MAEYAPLFKPGDEFTSATSAAVSAGKCLVASGDNTVAQSSAASAAFVGIAAFDAGSGSEVTVITEGIHLLDASGAINAGDNVTTAASGAVAAFSGTTYNTIIGKALAAAANGKVKVLLP